MLTKTQENSILTDRIGLTNLLTYSFVHALVDASCAAIVAAVIAAGEADLIQISLYVILYNTIAFSLQAPIGLAVDHLRKPVETAVLGCLLVLAGIIAYRTVGFALIIAGVGNALFHIGGGVTVLNLKPGKASLPGIFVAPGAIGLLIGTLIGKSQYFSSWSFGILLMASAVIIFTIKRTAINYKFKIEENFSRFNIIFICVLASISIRGLVGFMLNYPWKANILLLTAFTAAVALGKALGGILGDRFGWTRVTIWGLVISAPLLVLGINIPILAILGVFLFNLTMPVTLVVISNMMPGRAGFAFGLTTLALIIGSFPTFTELRSIFCTNNGAMIFGAVILMALLLKAGLKLFFFVSKSEIAENQSNLNL